MSSGVWDWFIPDFPALSGCGWVWQPLEYILMSWSLHCFFQQISSKVSFFLQHCCLAPCKSVTNYGPLTEPKFCIVKCALSRIPTSNGRISETKRAILDPLVPKFSSDQGLKVASRHSFTLFRPLSGRKTRVFQVCPAVPLWSEYAPGPVFQVGKKKFTRPPIVWLAV